VIGRRGEGAYPIGGPIGFGGENVVTAWRSGARPRDGNRAFSSADSCGSRSNTDGEVEVAYAPVGQAEPIFSLCLSLSIYLILARRLVNI